MMLISFNFEYLYLYLFKDIVLIYFSY